MSVIEHTFALQLRAHRIDGWIAEYRFAPPRRWRADFAWPASRLLVEIEGGTFVRGRHTRPLGYRADCEKYNAAQEAGFIVLRYTTDMVSSGEAVNQVARVLENRGQIIVRVDTL